MKTLWWIVCLPFRLIGRVSGILFGRKAGVTENKPSARKGFSFWRLAAGALCGFLVAGSLVSVGILLREKFRGELPRLVDYGQLAYVSRIVDRGGRQVVYVIKEKGGPECLTAYAVIDQRVLSCQAGDEVIYSAGRGFVPTRSGFAREVAPVSLKKLAVGPAIIPGLIPIEEVPDEGSRAVYEGVPIVKKAVSAKRVIARR